MDDFLSRLLQVVIVVDVAAAIAYFVLGGLKRSRRRRLEPAPAAPAPAPVPDQGPRTGPWQRWRRRRSSAEPPTAGDLAQLHRILQAFHEGLT